jgi:carbonic anhydrase/acetyltransferase-like protein (isoleucine patch superfamily)
MTPIPDPPAFADDALVDATAAVAVAVGAGVEVGFGAALLLDVGFSAAFAI